jgi:hypothetical protein
MAPAARLRPSPRRACWWPHRHPQAAFAWRTWYLLSQGGLYQIYYLL